MNLQDAIGRSHLMTRLYVRTLRTGDLDRARAVIDRIREADRAVLDALDQAGDPVEALGAWVNPAFQSGRTEKGVAGESDFPSGGLEIRRRDA